MKRILLPLLGLFMSMTTWAMPAKPGIVTMTQPDGTKIQVYIHGDEHFHYYETLDGKVLLPAADGTLKYAELDANGKVVAGKVSASNAAKRSAKETNAANKANASATAMRQALVAQAEQAMEKATQPGSIKVKFPTKGTVRGLIVLAEYQDIKFSKQGTLERFQQMAMADDYQGENAPGSMRDYFITQSGGQFTPEFDVVGPVTLPNKRVYYGGSDTGSERITDMMKDAATLAHDQLGVNFSKYDANNDGYVDFFYVIFAGHGQAQGGPEECVWPAAIDLSDDVSIPEMDGMFLGRSACSCELSGGSGETLDGIGTFCHEFSHILGLPDVYDVNYAGFYGMNHYDIMDRGGYNNDGKTPCGYTAMDKYTVGWLTPTVLDKTQKDLKLEDLATSNQTYFIVSPTDKNEYYTLENRQANKWDAGLPGHGLLISHIKYSQILWNTNRVNTPKSGFEHIQLIPADNRWDDKDETNPLAEANDVFPGVDGLYTEFTATTKPALTWRTGDSSEGQGITNIRLQDGVVTFDYNNVSTGIEAITKSNAASSATPYYTLEGVKMHNSNNLPKGIYIHGNKKVIVK